MYSRRRSKETDVVDISLRNFDHVGRVLQQVSALHVGKYNVYTGWRSYIDLAVGRHVPMQLNYM